MKLIVWWLGLMVILPSLYLFWQKKRWRLLFGIIILVVAVISFWAPSEIAHSILTTEIEKEQPSQQLEKNLRSILNDDEPKPSDSEQRKLEKSIVKSSKELEKLYKKRTRGEKLSAKEFLKMLTEEDLVRENRKEWVEKWGKKENRPALLFCGEEFNEELTREQKFVLGHSSRPVESYNIIDFGQAENNKLDSFKKKLQAICQQDKNNYQKIIGNSPIIWLKNIDKITNSELKNELVKVVDPSQNTDLGEYQTEIKNGSKLEQKKKTIDLSQFTLIATTSTTNPKLSKKLQSKLKHIEPFFAKYFWILFFVSGGMEIIIFLLLIRSQRKSKNKSLRHLEY